MAGQVPAQGRVLPVSGRGECHHHGERRRRGGNPKQLGGADAPADSRAMSAVGQVSSPSSHSTRKQNSGPALPLRDAGAAGLAADVNASQGK